MAVRDTDRLAARRDRDRAVRGLRLVARRNPKNALDLPGAPCALDALACWQKTLTSKLAAKH